MYIDIDIYVNMYIYIIYIYMYIYRYAAQGEMKLLASPAPKRAQFTCFTGTKVQILTPEAQSSIRDEAPAPTKKKIFGGAAHVQENKFVFFFHAAQVEMGLLDPTLQKGLSLLALLVQRYKY
jgi:hypothetical protein